MLKLSENDHYNPNLVRIYKIPKIFHCVRSQRYYHRNDTLKLVIGILVNQHDICDMIFGSDFSSLYGIGMIAILMYQVIIHPAIVSFLVVGHNVDRQNVDKKAKKKYPPPGLDPANFWVEDPSLTG